MTEKIRKVLVAIPTSGMQFSEFSLALRLLKIPENCQIAFAMAKRLTADAARNNVLQAMPEDVDYILYLDDDILVPDDALEKLLSHDKDIVSGLYFKNAYPFVPMMYRHEKDGRYEPVFDYAANELVEVDACGAGCMLVKTDVFKKLKRPYFRNSEADGGLSEDFHFCKNARDAGFGIYCDTSVNCAHMSSGPIDSRTWGNVKDRIKEEYAKRTKK